MLPSGTPDLARHLDDQMRAQERQLLGVRIAVVVLGTGFLIVFGEPIAGRLPLMGLLAGVALYTVALGLMLQRLPTHPVAVLGVGLDLVAVTGVVWIATNVPDSYLFYALVILGTAIRFGMVPSIAASVLIGLVYMAVVTANPAIDAEIGPLLPVRVLFLVMFGVVAGLFSQIIMGGAAENARLQLNLEAERAERERATERDQLSRLARDFAASLDRAATARAVTSGAASLLGDATLLLAYDATDRRLVPEAVDGPDRELARRWFDWADGSPPRLGEGAVGIAASERRQRLAHAGDDDAGADRLGERGQEWVLATPIVVGGRLIGVLATCGAGDRACDARMRMVAEALAERAGPALQNAQLWSDLQKQVAREHEAQRVKDDFLSVVSHELRTPLTSIQGYSQLLESRLRTEGGRSKELTYVGVILSQVMRMRRLVDDLLDVHRMDSRGGMQVEPVDFDLAQLLAEAVARARRGAPERNIELVAPASLPVHLDRERVDQVLGNLLDNALKYSPDGGVIRVVATDKANAIEVRVSDTGVGIAAEDRERVFERFYQADDADGRRRFGGLGLGLAISRAIVEAHRGQIWAAPNDEAGAGTVFVFRVPREAKSVDLVRLPDEEASEPPSFVRRRLR